MSEGAEETKPKQGVKRARPKSVPKKGVTVIGNHLLCSYSGRIVEKAIFVPGLAEVCFANLPCAFAWIEEHVREPERQTMLKNAVCDRYEQPIDSVVRAPDWRLLEDFGGDRNYQEWIGPLKFWDVLTQSNGMDVKAYQESLRGGKKSQKTAASKVTFEAGMHLLQMKGQKAINALDGKVEKGAKETLTATKAYKKVSAFASTQKVGESDFAWHVQSVAGESFAGWVVTPPESADPEQIKKYRNHVASQVTNQECYGPGVLIFTRKAAIKV